MASLRLLALPHHLRFDEGQTKIVFTARYFWWLVLRVRVVHVPYSYRRIGVFGNSAVRFVLLLLSSPNALLIFLAASSALWLSFIMESKKYLYVTYFHIRSILLHYLYAGTFKLNEQQHLRHLVVFLNMKIISFRNLTFCLQQPNIFSSF